MSIAGGYHNAVIAAQTVGCDTVQLFTKNNTQWRAKAMTDDEARLFRDALGDSGITVPTAHNGYLINLASPDAAVRKRSIDAMVEEVRRAERLGLTYLIAHPGSHLDGSITTGLARVAQSLDEIHAQTRGAHVQILLEITAGQGSNLGHRFEHLAVILGRARDPERLGICFDTCHAFAAGYALSTRRDYHVTMRELDTVVGIHLVKAIHLNDSKREFASRVDRHEHIGRGQLGLAAFQFILNDARFRGVPMYLETPKGTEKGKDLDAINLQTLRRLVR